MERIIQLMSERNIYLGKYHKLNEREIKLYEETNFDSLDAFYETRQAILDVISAFDEKIDEELMEMTILEVNKNEEMMADLLTAKDDVIQKILDQDLRILSMIESEKSKVLQEFLSTQKNRQVVGAYTTGEKKNSFDQEA